MVIHELQRLTEEINYRFFITILHKLVFMVFGRHRSRALNSV